MQYLPPANRVALGETVQNQVVATGKDVVVIGGGDTGADCLGTAHRQGARSVTQLEIMPTPPDERPGTQPWPTYPMIYRVSSAHEEGGERLYALNTVFLRRRRQRRGRRAEAVVEVELVEGKFTPGRAPSGSSRPSWCCWRWASPARSAARCWSSSASRWTAAGNIAANGRLHVLGSGGLRRRRRRAWTILDCLGDRGGPRVRSCRWTAG